MDTNEMKQKSGYSAAEWVQDGMLIGLGTGSTVFYFIEKLIERCQQGLKIQAISSSNRSLEQAKQGGIPLADVDQVKWVDLTVDGADEIDSQKRMIKGGGGALLREKVLANISRKMLVIIDETKLVEKLGNHPLPVEILPFAHTAIIDKIKTLGFTGNLRQNKQGSLYYTDNGNLIYDIQFDVLREHPEKDHENLIQIPGVLETGFFFNFAKHILVARSNGQIDRID